MRRHPQFAFDMLQPIAYLRPALTSPTVTMSVDGTGYPRNLKGEQIPLAARIFAVCRCLGRSYRKRPSLTGRAIQRENREHIRSSPAPSWTHGL